MSKKDTDTEKKLLMIKEVLQNIKNDRIVWDPVMKAAEKYSQALKTMSLVSRQFYDTLSKVGEQAAHANGGTNDLGVGIQTIAEHFKQLENKRDLMIKSLVDDLATPLDKQCETWKKEAINLEKGYQSQSKKLSSEIKDAEKDSQKAGKKGQPELKKAIEALNAKVKDMETLRQSTLRNSIIEERKRYCFFIMHFATVMSHEMAMHEQATNAIKPNISQWTQLAVSPDQLPPEIEQLVEIQQRTFVSVQASDSINVANYYDDSDYDLPRAQSFSSTYSTYSTYDMPRNPPPSSAVDDVIRIGDQVKALYAYSGDNEKLSFREGDIMNVKDIDPSGWCLGDLYGTSGWFPSNYVEKVKKAPAPAPVPFTPPVAYKPPTPAPVPFTPPVAYKPPAPAPAPASYSSYSAPPAPAPYSSYGAPPAASYATPPAPPKNIKPVAAPPMMGGGGAPPPPPMMGGGAPPPPGPPPPVSSGSGDRGALLSSIHKGAKLKKAVTNDRSQPKLTMK